MDMYRHLLICGRMVRFSVTAFSSYLWLRLLDDAVVGMIQVNGSNSGESFKWSWDTLAERLRRRPAKPMGSARVGSNPTGVVFARFTC